MKSNLADNIDFGKWVKKRLIDLNMSQTTLSNKLGIQRQYLYKILSGKRSGVKYKDEIIKILK